MCQHGTRHGAQGKANAGPYMPGSFHIIQAIAEFAYLIAVEPLALTLATHGIEDGTLIFTGSATA